ncbi:hypothetical protein [Ferruginibacter sp.]
MKRSTNLLFIVLLFIGCSNAGDNTAKAQGQQKISQFERAGLCDFLIDKNGTYHVVFQESPAIGKPVFIYYSSSSNKGVSWSKPVTLSNDNSGNGSGYARILQDATGNIYAIWKRYGNTESQYPEGDATLDGPGGYLCGTLFYKVLSGGTWSAQVQLNENQKMQNSWFATLTPQGTIAVFWSQGNPESNSKTSNIMWYYCDYLRYTILSGTSHTAYVDLNKPAPLVGGMFPNVQNGLMNLDGYVDSKGTPHIIYEDKTDNVQQMKYYDGKSQRVIYSFAKYSTNNTFNHPPKLLVDEKGIDHVIFLPSPTTLESEQVWDINLGTNQTNVLTSIQKPSVTISGLQAKQGPNGAMAITIEAGAYASNTEAYGLFYKNGTWTNIGLTNNAAKEKFFSREFEVYGGYHTILASITRYNSVYSSVAYDAQGKKSMVMDISAYWTSGGYSTSSPSIVFSPIDK